MTKFFQCNCCLKNKSTEKFRQIFVAFSEHVNIKRKKNVAVSVDLSFKFRAKSDKAKSAQPSCQA